MKLSNKAYDICKYIVQIFFPALICLVGTVLKVLNVENVDLIVTIMTAVETFLGSVLMISNITYKKEMEEKKDE